MTNIRRADLDAYGRDRQCARDSTLDLSLWVRISELSDFTNIAELVLDQALDVGVAKPVKRPLVQTALTEALERQGMTFDRILKPVVDALDATVVAHTLAGPVKTKLPDHRIRLEPHNRLVSLYGGTPRASEIPPLPAQGL